MPDIEIHSLATLAGLILAIILIIRHVSPTYAMMIGALAASLLGGLTLDESMLVMMSGAEDMVSVIIRVLAAGVLAGVLIESGAAKTLAETIFKKMGEGKALLAIAAATMILTGVGVFIVVAVLTVAPIALSIAHRANISKMGVLLAISGGGKAGNIFSPNPNTIAVADSFDVSLTAVMAAGLIPGLVGLGVTFMIAQRLAGRGDKVERPEDEDEDFLQLPSLPASLAAPVTAVGLLMLQPLFGVNVDPLFALPAGGAVGALAMGRFSEFKGFAASGLSKMVGVAVLFIGVGSLAGVLTHSTLVDELSYMLNVLGLPDYMIAPVSGMFMGAATGSTSAGTAIAGGAFADTLLAMGVHAVAAAAMLHAGTIVLDHTPQGSFFHVTRESVNMSMKDRFKLVPYEILIGLVMAVVSVLMFGVFGEIFLS